MHLARRSSRSHPPGTLEHWPPARLTHSQRAAVNPRRSITVAWSRSPPYPPAGFRIASTPAGRANRERRLRRRTVGPARRGRVRLGGVGFDLVLAFLAPHDQPHACKRRRRAELRFIASLSCEVP